MMKKILIVIHDMRIGGAQKSLLSFLECLEGHENRRDYEIHLLPLNPRGEFLAQMPERVILEEPGWVLRWMSMPLSKTLLNKYFSLRGMFGEGLWLLRKALKLFPKRLNGTQRLWQNWRYLIPARQEAYDVAVAYMDGVSSFYVMDKVQAAKKVLWLHSDYQKQGYDAVFDAPYYAGCSCAVTVSEECRATLRRAHPTQADKMQVLENISSAALVMHRSQERPCDEFVGYSGLKLVTVGRLHEQKGIDLAVEAARVLKEKGMEFRWLAVGEGSERARLEALISRYGLEDRFILVGAQENPYTFMRACDILVQPSRVEGKSIVLDEAKMLCKPIVVTRYPTVGDSILHGETGWVTDMTGPALAGGILHMHKDAALRASIISRLEQLPKGNESLVNEYIRVMF